MNKLLLGLYNFKLVRYINLDSHTYKSMDVSGYRYNYEGFHEKFAYQIVINWGKRQQVKIFM